MRFNITDDTIREAYDQMYGRQGIFRIHEDAAGNPIFKVGGKTFNTPELALAEIDRTGITNFVRFEAGQRGSMIGAGRYGQIEEGLRAVRASNHPLAKSVTSVERYQYKASENVRHVYAELMKRGPDGKRVSHGFDIPGDTLTVLRFYAGDRELTSREILELKEASGENFEGAFNSLGKYDTKLAKRLKTNISIDEFGFNLDRKLKVHTLDLSSGGRLAALTGLGEKELEVSFDGIAMVNPAILHTQVDDMIARAKDLKKTKGNGPEAVKARQSGEALERKAKELRKKIKVGGSFETFRAEGLIGPEGDIVGLAKADAIIPSQAGWLKAADEMGFDPTTDLVLHPKGITPQYGIQGGIRRSFFTTKMNEPNEHIFTEIESLTSTPELYPLETMNAHTLSVFRARTEEFMSTGKLPDDLRKYYQGIVDRDPSEVTGNIFSFADQQARARHLLRNESLGVNPYEDPAYAREVFSSMTKWLKSGRRPGDPRFLAPGTIGAHIRPSLYSKATGYTNYDVAPGEIGFHRSVGMLMNEGDIYKYHNLFGGFDLDDLLRSHMFNVDGKIKAFGVRNPHSTGELASFNVAHGSMGEVVLQLGKSHPGIKKTNGYAILNTQSDLDALDNEISLLRSEIRQLTSQGKPTSRKATTLAKREATHDRLNAKLEQLSTGMSEADIANIPEDLLQQHLPKMTPELFEQLHYPHAKAKIDPKTGMFEVDKDPIFLGWEEWKASRAADLTKHGYEPIKSRVKFSAEDFRMNEVEDLPALMLELRKQGVDYAKAHGLIGRYRNVDILASSLRQQIKDKGIPAVIPFTPTEDIADVLMQGVTKGSLDMAEAYNRMTGMIYGLAEAVGKHGIKLPRELFEADAEIKAAGGKSGRITTKEEQDKFWEFLDKINPNIDKENIWLDNAIDEERAWNHHATQVAHSKRGIEFIENEERRRLNRLVSTPKHLENMVFTAEEEFHAARIAGTYDLAKEQLKRSLATGKYKDEYSREVTKYLENSVESASAQEAARVMSNIVFEEDGTLGEKGLKVLGAFSRNYGWSHSQLTNRHGTEELIGYANAYHKTEGFNRNKLDEMLATEEITPKQHRNYIKLGAKPPTKSSIESKVVAKPWIETTSAENDAEVIRRINVGDIPGAIRNQETRRAAGMAEELLVSPTRWEDINMRTIKDLFAKHPGARQASIGAAALIAGSFIYRKFRDRTPEQMQGPPLLPGGSAYEPSTAPTMPPALDGGGSSMPYDRGGGVTFRVIARGEFDHQQARSQAENITGGTSSGTIYNARNTSKFGNHIPGAISRSFGR